MSRRNKLKKFSDIAGFPNVYENFSVEEPRLLATGYQPVDLKGKWNSDHFKSDKPITLELACGRGEYTLGLARHFPDRHFIGVDIKGARIWKGAKQALEEGLDNAAFLRTRIECIDEFFGPGEISEIWITFPDPFPRVGQANRRLTSGIFLDKYRKVLKPGGLMHLKTDNTGLFMYSLEVIAGDATCELQDQVDDVYSLKTLPPELAIPTFYENVHREAGALIKYVRWVMSGE